MPKEITNPECDHEWFDVDASFDHEFGTEKIFYQECDNCGKTRPMPDRSPEDDLI